MDIRLAFEQKRCLHVCTHVHKMKSVFIRSPSRRRGDPLQTSSMRAHACIPIHTLINAGFSARASPLLLCTICMQIHIICIVSLHSIRCIHTRSYIPHTHMPVHMPQHVYPNTWRVCGAVAPEFLWKKAGEFRCIEECFFNKHFLWMVQLISFALTGQFAVVAWRLTRMCTLLRYRDSLVSTSQNVLRLGWRW